MLIYFQGQIGTPSSARLISKLLTESGADHVITMDLHSELVINLKDDSNLTENIGDNSPCYDFIDSYRIVLDFRSQVTSATKSESTTWRPSLSLSNGSSATSPIGEIAFSPLQMPEVLDVCVRWPTRWASTTPSFRRNV